MLLGQVMQLPDCGSMVAEAEGSATAAVYLRSAWQTFVRIQNLAHGGLEPWVQISAVTCLQDI